MKVTAANVSDVKMTSSLLMGDEEEVYGIVDISEQRSNRTQSYGIGRERRSDTSRIASHHKSRSCPRAGREKQEKAEYENHLFERPKKRDTEDCGTLDRVLCCSRWRTWFWLTGIACRSESVRLA